MVPIDSALLLSIRCVDIEKLNDVTKRDKADIAIPNLSLQTALTAWKDP